MTYHTAYNAGRGRAFDDEGDSLDGAELDGLRVAFDQRVGLFPVTVQKTAGPSALGVRRAHARKLARRSPYGRR